MIVQGLEEIGVSHCTVIIIMVGITINGCVIHRSYHTMHALSVVLCTYNVTVADQGVISGGSRIWKRGGQLIFIK